MKEPAKGDKMYGRGQSRTQAWLGPLEAAIVEYLFKNGLERFQPIFISRELGVDRRRIHDALKRLEARGFIVKIARGFYKVMRHAMATIVDLPVRRLESKIRAAKDNKGTRGRGVPLAGRAGGFAGGSGRSGGLERFGGSGSVGEGDGDGGGAGVGAGGRADLGAFGSDAGADRCGGDPLFFDHVVGIRGSRYVNGEHGTLCWRDLVSYSLVSSAELGAFLDLSSWDGVLKIYWHRRYDWRLKMYIHDPRPRVEWQHPSGFLKANGIAEARRMFWRRVADAALALARLVFEKGPWWVARDLRHGLRGLGLCVA